MSKHAIELIDGTQISGSAPLVLIGPNGSGKSRMAKALSEQRRYKMLHAKRETTVNPFPGLPPIEIGISGRSIGDSLSSILHKFMEEENSSAVRFTQLYRKDPTTAGKPSVTRVSQLIELFEAIFPGRKLDLSDKPPSIVWTAESRDIDKYSTSNMSDGEKAGFELIARLLWTESGVLIVDEPEAHFHPLLAREFWTRIETFRSDCRFIYITHDISFALSRWGARIGIVRDERTVELIPENSPIPEDLVEKLIGAASVSTVAKRIIFCEGKRRDSLDYPFYCAWFHNDQSVVIPVGSCEQVQRAVSALKDNPIITNASFLGIVDRDYWPDGYLEKISNNSNVFVLPFHELESLFCIREVAAAIGLHFGKDNIDGEYREFIDSLKLSINDLEFSKIVVERSKCEVNIRIQGLMNKARPDKDISVARSKFVDAINVYNNIPEVGRIFDDIEENLRITLDSSENDLLKIIPGKHCLNLLSQKLGLNRISYVELIQRALNENEAGPLQHLRTNIIQALQKYLPRR